MEKTNPRVDHYLAEGCGRCPLGGTPDCKIHPWLEELVELRKIILETGLCEELKWSVPCYTYQKKNILILAAFKDYVAISFFKGALLIDIQGILIRPTPHVQAGRQMRFTSLHQVIQSAPLIKAFIEQAVEVEKKGLLVPEKNVKDFDIPEEFQQKMDESPSLRKAFDSLTPGRRKGYLLYFAAPKQSTTRISRIEKWIPEIMKGRGIHD